MLPVQVNLVEKGALTNAKKNIQTGKIVCSFAMGTKKLYSFLDDNSFVGQWIMYRNNMIQLFKFVLPTLFIVLELCIRCGIWWTAYGT